MSNAIVDEGACDHAVSCRRCSDIAELRAGEKEALVQELAFAKQVNETLNGVERLHSKRFELLARLLKDAGCPIAYPDLQPIDNVLYWLERRLREDGKMLR